MATKKKRVMIDVGPDGKTPVTTPTATVIPIKKAVVTKPGTPGYFNRVISNVKGRDMDMPLGACTAIVSPHNRAGKTAVLDAFRLALTGKHPIGSDAVDLAGLTIDGSPPKAGISGDAAASIFSFPDGKKTPVLNTTGEFVALQKEDVEKLLPLVTNRDLLTLGTAKAREGLFRRYGDPEKLAHAVDAPVGLSSEQVALWDKAIKGEGRLGAHDTVEKLASAGTWIRSHKLGLGKEVKGLEEEKQRLHDMAVAAGAGAPTDDLLAGVQRKIDIHRTLANTGLMRSRAQQAESRLNGLILAYQQGQIPQPLTTEAFEAAKAAINVQYPMEQLQKTAEAGREALAAQQKNVRLYTMMVGLRQHMLASGQCLACTTHTTAADGAAVQKLVAEAESALKTAQMAVQVLEHSQGQDEAYFAEAQQQRAAEHQALETQRAQQTNAYERFLADVRAAKLNVEAGMEMLKEAGVEPAPAEPLEVLQQQLQTLQAAKAEGNRAAGLATEVRKLMMEIEDTKTIEKELGKRLNELVAAIGGAAQTAVNAWMPPGFVAALVLSDEDGKPACRWEIVGADGRPHPRGAASGAEWAALTVAIACAWSEGQKYRFLLLDDTDLAGFSAENVRNALTMVADAVKAGRLTQALVAWSRPAEIPDDGWSVVSL